jgi:hypothetical protein
LDVSVTAGGDVDSAEVEDGERGADGVEEDDDLGDEVDLCFVDVECCFFVLS